MEITASGIFFIPLSVFLLVYRPDLLLPAAVVLSPFIPMSVLNVTGGFELGISPWFWFGIIIAVRELLQLLYDNYYPAVLLKLLMVFAIFCVCSGLVFPIIFKGLPVYLPRGGLDDQVNSYSPLEWSFSNFGQVGYILINVLIVACALRQGGNGHRWFIVMFLLFSFVFMWQLASVHLGIPYPSDFIYSNPVYYFGSGQSIGEVQRINGPFSEPSNAGMFLAACIAYFLAKRQMVFVFIACCLSAISTSSVGYVSAAGCLVVYYFYEFIGMMRDGVIRLSTLVAFVVFVVAIVALAVNMQSLLQLIIFEKSSSGSFLNRFAADIRGVEIFIETYGLGAGLGSNRSSSFLVCILSNIGIIGSSLFFLIILKLGTLVSQKDKPLFIALLAYVMAKSMAGPDLNESVLWALIAMVAMGYRSENSVILNSAASVK